MSTLRSRNPARLLGHMLMASLVLAAAACADRKPAAEAAAQEETAAPEAAPASDALYAIVRVPTNAEAPAQLDEAIAQGRRSGAISYALRLDSTQEEKAGFASVAILGFSDPAAREDWRQASAQALAAPVQVALADRLYHVENPERDSSIAVFQGNYMQPKIGPEAYVDFADRYMKKYLELQREAGILTSYAMYLERPQPDGEGLAFMMREHADQGTFDDRNSTKDRLRDELMARDADYKRLEDTAIEYRSHVSSTRARFHPIP